MLRWLSINTCPESNRQAHNKQSLSFIFPPAFRMLNVIIYNYIVLSVFPAPYPLFAKRLERRGSNFIFFARFLFAISSPYPNGLPCPGYMIFGLSAMIVSHDFRYAVLSSAQIVIRCKLGNPFIAASPQNREPSFRKREIESAV